LSGQPGSTYSWNASFPASQIGPVLELLVPSPPSPPPPSLRFSNSMLPLHPPSPTANGTIAPMIAATKQSLACMAAIVAQFFDVCRHARAELFVLEERISDVGDRTIASEEERKRRWIKGFYLRVIVTFLITGMVVGRSPRTSTLAILWIVSTGPHSPKIV
jgi:hypothetical protein